MDNFALVIGAMKCGTTSLFNYLAEHPQVSASSKKETHFFSKTDFYLKGFDYYKSFWKWNPDIYKVAIESTPNYTNVTHETVANAAENILSIKNQYNLKFKFIYIMRNPIDRIESHYTHLQAWGVDPTIKPIVEGIDSKVIDVSKYAMQIEEYYKRFSSDSIFLLNFEEFKANPISMLKKICIFLDICPDYKFQKLNNIYNQNSERIKINLPGWQLIRKTQLMQSIVRLVPDESRQVFRDLFGQKIKNYVKLSPKQKKNVLQELHFDLKKLKSNYGVDLNYWGIDI